MEGYNFKITFTYIGTVRVSAENREEAEKLARDSFGLHEREIKADLLADSPKEKGILDWDIPLQPSKKIETH